jgi:hypothetical protein
MRPYYSVMKAAKFIGLGAACVGVFALILCWGALSFMAVWNTAVVDAVAVARPISFEQSLNVGACFWLSFFLVVFFIRAKFK